MCIQDYRMGIRTRQEFADLDFGINNATTLLPACADRHSVIVSLGVRGDFSTGGYVSIGYTKNSVFYALGVLSQYVRSIVLSVGIHGSSVRNELFAINETADEIEIVAIDNQFITTPEDAADKRLYT